MLRFVREGEGEEARWRPAAGSFTGWPRKANDITTLDPCCGSGHFLTEALAIMVALRQVEENLSSLHAVAAVLRENLHGLEIDGRCVQIATFAVALTAWRIGGWQILPLPHIAWVGAPPLPKLEFVALANGDFDMRAGLAALHDLFAQAPILGSLIEPRGGHFGDRWRLGNIEPLLEKLITKIQRGEPEVIEGAIAARGITDAVSILSRQYTLQFTNVPFLGQGKQADNLANHIDSYFNSAKADLASAMILRMRGLTANGGTVASVSPQGWWYLGRYRRFRIDLFETTSFRLFVALGNNSFQTPMYFFNVGLSIIDDIKPTHNNIFSSIDASNAPDPDSKEGLIISSEFRTLSQSDQFKNPDHRISNEDAGVLPLLSEHVSALSGCSAGDAPRYIRKAWEISALQNAWEFHQTTVAETALFSGKNEVIFWENEKGAMYDVAKSVRHLNHAAQNWLRGKPNWGKQGVCVSQMGDLKPTLYTGEIYDCNACAVVPQDPSHLPALWSFSSSGKLGEEVRKLDRSLKVTPKSLIKIPFDLEHWKKIAERDFPNGLPDPYSDDPTQWLFHGHPAPAEKGAAIHVAFARLCGYCWPAETDQDMRLSAEAHEWIARAATLPEGDQDGLLAVAGVAGEKPLTDRLRGYLAAAFGAEWSDALERRLVAEADEVLDKKAAKDGSLEAWLRDRAFRQHCALFHQRPFLWHIWDGLKDGFSVFVHYHRFTQANLRKLTYTMLGDWLARAKAENNDLRYEKARELQQMLENVLDGEKPYDIFVRWKPLAEQPLGWDPDVDDGVRMNIRPFIDARILREHPKGIKWTKDRGNDVPSAPWFPVFKGERINDHHTTLEEKRAARAGKPQMVTAK